MTRSEEYLRRNLMVAKAIGVKANTRSALQRLEQQANPPRWLVLALRGILDRAEPLPAELAQWRDSVRAGTEAAIAHETSERRHHTESGECWCGPTLNYVSDDGVQHWVHHEPS